MPNLDWNTIRVFGLGALTAIVFAIIANLLTPDRRWLLSWVRSWWASQSVNNATTEINRLKVNLKEVEDLANDPNRMFRYVARQLLGFAMVVCLAGALVIMLNILEIPFHDDPNQGH